MTCLNFDLRRAVDTVSRLRLLANDLVYRPVPGAEIRSRRTVLATFECRPVELAGAVHCPSPLRGLPIATALELIQGRLLTTQDSNFLHAV